MEKTADEKLEDANAALVDLIDRMDSKKPEYGYNLSRNFAIIIDDEVISKVIKILKRFGGEVSATIVRRSDLSQVIPAIADVSEIAVPAKDSVKSFNFSTGDHLRRFEFEFRDSNFETFVARAYADEDTVVLFKNEVDEVVSLARPWYDFFARKSDLLSFAILILVLSAFYVYQDFSDGNSTGGKGGDIPNWQLLLGVVMLASPFFILVKFFNSVFPKTIFSYGKNRNKPRNLRATHMLILTALFIPLLLKIVVG